MYSCLYLLFISIDCSLWHCSYINSAIVFLLVSYSYSHKENCNRKLKTWLRYLGLSGFASLLVRKMQTWALLSSDVSRGCILNDDSRISVIVVTSLCPRLHHSWQNCCNQTCTAKYHNNQTAANVRFTQHL